MKGYRFTYWFAFPAISSIQISLESTSEVPQALLSTLSLEDSKAVWVSGFFLADLENSSLKSLKEDSGREIFGYIEPSGVPGIPGWTIRNYLAYIIRTRYSKNMNFILNRLIQAKIIDFDFY